MWSEMSDVPDAKATYDGWTAYVYDPGCILTSPSLLAESLARNHPKGDKAMTDEQHDQVVQDNLALIDRNHELELQLDMCKKALGECGRLADEIRKTLSDLADEEHGDE